MQERETEKKKESSQISGSTTQTRLDPGSIGYLPDICSGLTLGLISG